MKFKVKATFQSKNFATTMTTNRELQPKALSKGLVLCDIIVAAHNSKLPDRQYFQLHSKEAKDGKEVNASNICPFLGNTNVDF